MITSRIANVLVIVLGALIAAPSVALLSEYRETSAWLIALAFVGLGAWCMFGGVMNFRRPTRPEIPRLASYRIAGVLVALILSCVIGAYCAVLAAALQNVLVLETVAFFLARALLVLLAGSAWLLVHHRVSRSRLAG